MLPDDTLAAVAHVRAVWQSLHVCRGGLHREDQTSGSLSISGETASSVHDGGAEPRGPLPAALRWISTHRHASVSGTDGGLSADQEGLFNVMLVGDGGGKHGGWHVSRAGRMRSLATFTTIFCFHLSMACGHHLDCGSGCTLHGPQASAYWWKSSSCGWVARSTRDVVGVQDH